MSGQPMPPTALQAANAVRLSLDDLVLAIPLVVAPESWDEAGGAGTLLPLAGMLIVQQTPPVHRQIERFLQDLREETRTNVSISVDARWLLLDSQQASQLTGAGKRRRGAVNRVDRKALAALAGEAERFHGQVSCLNGQTVHIVSGRLHTVRQGGIPIVSGDGVGYQSLIDTPHVGALLQVTPSLLPGSNTAMVDVGSQVARRAATAAAPAVPAGAAGANSAQNAAAEAEAAFVERLNVVVQQLATSLRLPLGEPVLVGGLSFPAEGELEDSASKQMYLVLEVNANELGDSDEADEDAEE